MLEQVHSRCGYRNRKRQTRVVCGLFFLICLLVIAPSVPAADYFEGVVDQVLSGDKVLLRGGTIVQYVGIGVPDTDIAQPAKEFNKKMVEKKRVRLELVRPEGVSELESRQYAYVFVGGQMINTLLLKKGYALLSAKIPPGEKYREYFVACQNEAMTGKKGFWRNVSSRRR